MIQIKFVRTLAACVLVIAGAIALNTLYAQGKKPPEIRYVVIHKPGPQWKPGVAAFEQPGLQAHVEHFSKLLKAGKLALGGPYMDEASGGMMIPEPAVTEAEMRAFASEDPAVKSGLLVFEIRPWMAALHR